MLKVNIKHMVDENGQIGILDIIQWCHKNNRFGHPFGISFYPPNDENTSQQVYMEAKCAQLMNAVSARWPQAQIINTL